MPEAPGSALDQTEQGVDERPISPRFTLVLTVEAIERSLNTQRIALPRLPSRED
jgi:hypothetical protein